MGQMYDAIFPSIAVTALQDFFEILAPADAVIIVHGWEIFQTSDVGDAEEEILELETVRGLGATTGSGGATIIPQPNMRGYAVSGTTTKRNNTTRLTAGGGSLEILEKFGWNIRIPLEKIYTPESRPVVSASDFWTLALPSAPNDELSVIGKVTFEEIGG